jgi:urease beta subunit
LSFDRHAARGQRLDVPAGPAVRFEPGVATMVALVPFVGARVIAGLRGDVAGALDDGGPVGDAASARGEGELP